MPVDLGIIAAVVTTTSPSFAIYPCDQVAQVVEHVIDSLVVVRFAKLADLT